MMNSVTSLHIIFNLESIARTQRAKLSWITRDVIQCSSCTTRRSYGMITSFWKAPDLTIFGYSNNKKKTAFFQRETRALLSSKNANGDSKPAVPSHLTKQQMKDLVLHLTVQERIDLETALHEFHSKKTKEEYEGQLAGVRWRSTFGRPSKLPTLGDVDPTGTYCTVPEDWLLRKYAETVPHPTTQELAQVVVHNAIPFVGFGFLDNFCMILAGDQIEMTIGAMMVLSTMAAAALGNTISDIMGIGSAWYVERLALKIGIKPPKLTPIQLDMPSAHRASNLGRVLGVTIGCLLGMFPLMFIGKKKKKEEFDVSHSPQPESPET